MVRVSHIMTVSLFHPWVFLVGHERGVAVEMSRSVVCPQLCRCKSAVSESARFGMVGRAALQ